MKLTILGSGSAIPTLTRNSPGYFLEIGKDKILIDCGSGTLRQLVRAKIDYFNLDFIFITHPHSDHMTDLAGIIQSIYIYGKIYKKKTKPLTVFGYKGFKQDYNQKLRKLFFPTKKADKFVSIVEIYNSKKQLGKWKVQSLPIAHTSYFNNTYRFEHSGKGIAISGDSNSNYDENLIKISQDVNLAILSCATSIQQRIAWHLSPKECGDVATKANVKKLVLSHFYPTAEKYDLKKQAQKYYKGPIVVAKDLMKIKI